MVACQCCYAHSRLLSHSMPHSPVSPVWCGFFFSVQWVRTRRLERSARLCRTLDEKIVMLHGPTDGPKAQCNTSAACAYVGNVAPNPRLGIPPITMNDGPQGFRDNVNPGTTTAWPSGLTMAASWDIEAMLEWGDGMGKEVCIRICFCLTYSFP